MIQVDETDLKQLLSAFQHVIDLAGKHGTQPKEI